MVDLLTEIDVLELLVQVLNSLVNHIVNHHARSHEAFSNGFHFADVQTFLRKRHVLEAQKFLVYFLLIEVALSYFHRDSSITHFHVFKGQVHLISGLYRSIVCLLLCSNISIFEMLLFRVIHVY